MEIKEYLFRIIADYDCGNITEKELIDSIIRLIKEHHPENVTRQNNVISIAHKAENSFMWSIDDMLDEAKRDSENYDKGMVILWNSETGDIEKLYKNLNKTDAIALLEMAKYKEINS